MIEGIHRRYKTIVVDPPWPSRGYPGKDREGNVIRTRHAYNLMSLDEIADMEIQSIATDDAFVFLWTINRFLRDAFDVLDAWELRYMFTMVWHKPHGPKPVGYPIYNAEFVVVGRYGSPRFTETTGFWTANQWEGLRSPNSAPTGWGKFIASAKPDGFYDMIRQKTPQPRIDMFARRAIPGFDRWGNEAPE